MRFSMKHELQPTGLPQSQDCMHLPHHGGGHAKQTAPPPNELQLPCPLKNQMISRCAIVRTNELQSTRHFSQTKPRGGRAKTMKQPCTATLPPNELQCGQRRQHCHSHNQGTTPPRTNMRTKGRATVQSTTRATAALTAAQAAPFPQPISARRRISISPSPPRSRLCLKRRAQRSL